MAGFSSVIGFVFAFFSMILLFSGIFIIYNEQLFEQISLLESRGLEYTDSTLYGYELKNYYFSSGRLRVEIENQGFDLKFREKNSICFDFFLDDLFFPKNRIEMTVPGHLPNIYTIIEEETSGYVHLKRTVLENTSYELESSSCGGIENRATIDSDKYNWWNQNWLERDKVFVENTATSSLVEYQVEIDLNSTNFDFNLGREDEIRFIAPLEEFMVLDLPLDDYSQTLTDYSKYSNDATLGLTIAIQASDPQEVESAVLFGGLTFDGSLDQITITDDDSLDLDEELTYSMWVKWNEQGDSFQTLVRGSNLNNYLRIINDSSANNSLVEFSLEVDGSQEQLLSNVTLDSSWHFITSTYDGSEMKIYIDGKLSGNKSASGIISTGILDTLIGADILSNYYNGEMDEIKIYNIALKPNEVQELYESRQSFRELDYYISSWSGAQEISTVFVKIPYLGIGENATIEIYYDNRDPSLLSNSNIESAFTYNAPRIIGYPVSDRVSSSIGLTFLSFYNDTIVMVDSTSFSLDEMQTQDVGSGSVNQGSEIRSNKFVNVQGNGAGGDILVPVSWAATQFYASGMRNNPDTWCILSPWGDANVVINEAGSQVNIGTVDATGTCFSNNTGTANGIEITSDIPVLAYTYGDTSDDAYAIYPATTEDIYAVGTDDLYYSAPNGASINYFDSDGNTGTYSVGASEGGNDNNQGQHGTAPAFRFSSTEVKGGIHQADGDGGDSGIFVPEKEMGYIYGSSRDSEWIGIASPYPNANCSVYNTAGFVENDASSTGANGVYKYGFDLGDNSLYEAGPWRIECDEKVWPLFDDDGSQDETSMLSHPTMRQYIHPEPTISYLG